jgi:FRG domain
MDVGLTGFSDKEEERRPRYPQFKSFNDNIDDRIPSCVVEDWRDFLAIMNDEREQANDNEKIWRGQRRYDWPLESKLTRAFGGGAIDPSVRDNLLYRFKLAMRGRGIDLSEKDENEVWAYGQHFGLATPLMDWTQSPFVAQFFAFVDEHPEAEQDNPYRAVFRLNKGRLEADLPELFFEPALGENVRLVNQAGLFTVTPDGENNLVTKILNHLADNKVDMGDDNEIAKYICKIHIPVSERPDCLAMLRRMNIHHANLFPDPGGASLYCNDWLARCVAEDKAREEKEAEARKAQQRIVKLELKDIAGMDIDVAQQVKQVIIEALGGELVTEDAASIWAMKIDAKYNEEATIDWTKHQSSTSRIRVGFRRLLNLVGCPEEGRDAVVDALIKFYTILYEGKQDNP